MGMAGTVKATTVRDTTISGVYLCASDPKERKARKAKGSAFQAGDLVLLHFLPQGHAAAAKYFRRPHDSADEYSGNRGGTGNDCLWA
jgi:hypothetical protein